MILENDSLPLPLSPVIKTVISVGATWIATLTALFSRGEVPMIPNRCLTLCISASEIATLITFYWLSPSAINRLKAFRLDRFPHQGTTCTFLDQDVYILTLTEILLRKDNHFIR